MSDVPPIRRPRDTEPLYRPVAASPTVVAAAPRRVLWGAILAGVVVALVVQLLLNLLGLGIGLETVDPAAGDSPDPQTFATVAGVWWLLASLIALFFGGWVAGRMSGLPLRVAGSLHGLVVWSVSTLIGVYLATSVIGSLASGVFGALGASASAVAEGVGAATSAAIPDRSAEGAEAAQRGNSLWGTIAQELRQMLRQTRTEELQPGALEQDAQALAQQARDAGRTIATNPQRLEQELRLLWNDAVARGQSAIAAFDREAMVNVLVARTDLTRAEAQLAVDRWSAQFESAAAEARQEAQQLAQRAEREAREAAQATAETVSTAALWAFGILVLGAIAAAAGGALGAPRSVLIEETYEPA